MNGSLRTVHSCTLLEVICHSRLTEQSRLYLDAVTCVHIFVFCSKMPPLETIHWSQITLLSAAETLLIQELT